MFDYLPFVNSKHNFNSATMQQSVHEQMGREFVQRKVKSKVVIYIYMYMYVYMYIRLLKSWHDAA